MNTRKLIVALMLIAALSMLMCSSAFAKSYFLTKDKKALDTKTSGDIEAISEETKTSGEEAKAEAPAEETKTSGEEAKAEAPAEETKTSGEEAKAEEPVEEAKTSGEEAKAEAPAEEVKASGEEAKVEEPAEEPKASGEEAKAEEPKAKDIEGSEWYAEYANSAVEEGIMKLDEEGNFNGDEKVTRADVLDALMNGVNAKYKIDAKNEEAFLKTKATREETAYLIYLYAQSVDKGFKGTWAFILDYEDQDQISQEAYEAMAWCNMNKIIIGRTETTLNPLQVATRAELATIVTRTVDVLK